MCKRGNDKKKPIKSIDSFEVITVREAGMRFTEEYELRSGDKAILSLYNVRYAKEGDERVLEKSVETDSVEILKILNDYKVASWNGFHGAHPKNVTDGIMFSLKGVVNGEKIYADGSENFPNGYREFINALREKLQG